MAKTEEREATGQPSEKAVGRNLRQVRKQQGLSRSAVARSAGLTRRELVAYERGRVAVPESDLWCLAGSCGVDVSELLPRRDPLEINSDLSIIGIGDTVRRLRNPGEPEGMLREYLSMIYELRNLPPGSRVPLRQADLAALADALGGTPEHIERRLIELIGASPDEAARLRAMILPPRSLPSGAPAPSQLPADPYASLAGGEVPPDVEAFFARPGAPDPFAPPPPPNPEWPPAAASVPPPAPPVSAPFAAPPDPAAAGSPFAAPPDPGAAGSPFAAPPDPAPSSGFAPAFAPAAAVPNGSSAGVVDAAAPDPWHPAPVFGPGPAVDPPSAATAVPPDAPPLSPSMGVEAPRADPFASLAPPEPGVSASDPFAGPVDASVTTALRDPFALPPTDDPLAPPPLPPDPFAVPSAPPPALDVSSDVRSPVDGSSPAAAADPPAVLDDPFAPPAALDGLDAPAEIDLGGPVLDAIVVDDPLSDVDAGPPPASRLDELPISPDLEPAPVAAPVAPPVAAPEAPPIAWSADRQPDLTRPAGHDISPRFERAGAHWQIGGIFPATAMADDGTLALRRADARWALTDLHASADCIIEATVDYRAGSGFGIVFRASTDDGERITGYSFDVDPVASGGGYLVRLWDSSRQHWRPLAQAPVTDPAQLTGRHVLELTLRADQLSVRVDGEAVLAVAGLSRCTVELGKEPCRGDRVGIQAWSTTEVTVESFRVANL